MSTTSSQLKSPPGYRQTESGLIPEDWLPSHLGDCGEVIMGQSPPGSSYNRAGKGSPLINGPTEFTDRHPIKIQWTTQPTRFCTVGDLLICVRGSSTGRTNYADDTYAIGRGVAAIRAKAENDTGYLSYQVIAGVSDILAAATGSTFPSVDGTSFRRIAIPLPPPAEQRAIAAALSDVDELIGALDAAVAKKRAIKLAAMQQLLTGKTRLPIAPRQWGTKPSEFGRIPGDWDVMYIADIFSATAGGDFDNKRSQATRDERHPFPIYSNAITALGLHGYCSYADHPAGSITVTARGTLGVANYRDHEYTAIGRVIVLEPRGKMDGRFFAEFINERLVFAIESTGVPQLTAPHISKYKLPVPPLLEQCAIAEVLVDMDTEIAAIEQRRDKTKAIKQGMMQSLLTGRVRLVKPEDTP